MGSTVLTTDTQTDRLQEYEELKKPLREQLHNYELTPQEYEQKIKQLAKYLEI